MSEARMWHNCVCDFADRCIHAERIENVVNEGDPDVHLCYQGVDIYWEFKAPKLPQRQFSRVQVGLRRAQLMWFADRYAAGGRAWVVVWIKEVNTLLAFSDPATLVLLYRNALSLTEMQARADLCTDNYITLLEFCYASVTSRVNCRSNH